MAEYILFESSNSSVSARVYADDSDDLPTRVEVSGVSGKYILSLVTATKIKIFSLNFDSQTTISRNISQALANQYTPEWQIGIEAV